jgi:hypothetical protein
LRPFGGGGVRRPWAADRSEAIVEVAACNSTWTGIYAMRGIDRASGCLVVVRPDQYVANVLPLDALDEATSFFSAFLLPAGSKPVVARA